MQYMAQQDAEMIAFLPVRLRSIYLSAAPTCAANANDAANASGEPECRFDSTRRLKCSAPPA